MAIGAFLILQMSYSPAQEYGLQKSVLYFYYNVLFFLIPYYFFPTKQSLDKIFKMGTIIGVLLILISILVVIETRAPKRLDPTGSGNVIWFGRVMGLLIFFFYYSFLVNNTPIKKILVFPLMGFAIFLLNISGSRGPLIAFLGAFFVYFLISSKSSWLRKIVISTGTLTILVSIFVIFFPNTIGRFTSFSNDPSSLLRAYSAINAWQLFLTNPLVGFGTGSFKVLVNETIAYPHNIFLELGMENGIIVVVLFISFLIYIFISLLRLRKSLFTVEEHRIYDISILIFLYGLFNAQFSGDIAHNPLLWFAAGTIYSTSKKAELNKV